MSDAVATKLDELGDAFQAVIGALKTMLDTQRLHGEMLRQVLAAVTEEPKASPLEDLLRQLVEADASNGRKLDAVLQALRG